MIFAILRLISCGYTSGIFAQHYHNKIVVLDVSGSSQQHINGSRQLTKPEYAVYPWDKSYDWCSNCGRNYDEHPWITFSLKNKKMRINGYYVRCGCCYDECCCEDNGYCCYDCCLYSWSLQISDDNKTWTEIHRVDRDDDMRRCNEKTYKLDKEYTCQFARLIQNEHCPGEPPCIALNKVEFYGEAFDSASHSDDFVSFHDDDDDVSIIGHISKNGHVRVE